MENNIDKFLRNALENHEEMPPSESWMHIHTEIAKQNRRVLTPILVGLLLGVLLISGLGISMYYASKSDEKLIVVSLNSKPLFIPKNIQNSSLKEVLSYKNNQVMAKGQFLPLSVSSQTTIGLLSVETQTTAIQTTVQSSVDTGTHSQTTAGKLFKNDSVQYFSEIKENIDLKNNEIQPVQLMAKRYISTDLSEKMNGALAKKIAEDYLEGGMVKEDSIIEETGKKFSLRHPIISYQTGVAWNKFSVEGNNSIMYPTLSEEYSWGSFIKLGIAWKVNKRDRIGFNFMIGNINNINLGLNIDPKSSQTLYFNTLFLTLNQSYSDTYYSAQTSLGDIHIPLSTLSQSGINLDMQNLPKSIKAISYPNSLTYIRGTVDVEHDIFSWKRKSGKQFQIYNIAGVFFQRQMSYNFMGSGEISPSSLGTDFPKTFSVTENHLENAAELVWGLKYGFGFRWQFAKKWDVSLEGSNIYTLNSWVKNKPYTTSQSMPTLQLGFNLNL